MEVKIMAYSSENCMVSKETAKKIRIKEIITKERREKLKVIFDKYQKAYRDAYREAKG
jgi:hypothetical protein